MQHLILTWPHALFFWLIFAWIAAPEFALVLKRTRSPRVEPLDAGSTAFIVVSTQIAVPLAFAVALLFPDATGLSHPLACFYAGLSIFLAAGLLRRHCIRALGDYFTIAIVVRPNHRIIQYGAYSYVRHPSYAASLIAYVGLGLALTNWLSLTLLLIAAIPAYGYRIAVEERVLAAKLGEPYCDYVRRTKKLIPFVY